MRSISLGIRRLVYAVHFIRDPQTAGARAPADPGELTESVERCTPRPRGAPALPRLPCATPGAPISAAAE